MKTRQTGFTLVEIAIVLVIIGLLLGGILKGQELINSARVRSMAEMNSGIQAAYYGFIDRYRRIPGDMGQTEANKAIAEVVTSGGNSNGQLDAVSGNSFVEAAAVWEHLSKAGFLQGSFSGGSPSDIAGYTTAGAPTNPFGGFLVLFRTPDYLISDGSTSTVNRMNLVLGNGIPVDIARELDVKLDDGKPLSGVLRLTTEAATGLFGTLAQTATSCRLTAAGSNDYDIPNDVQDCNVTFLY